MLGAARRRWFSSVPTTSRVVICGGGVIGTSVAHHLAELGWTDVTLVEQSSISSGTTWHASGLVNSAKNTMLKTAICSYSSQLYGSLQERGYNVGYEKIGSLKLASTSDRMHVYARQHARFFAYGFDSELLTAGQIGERYPFLHVTDLLGGIFIPSDASVNTRKLCDALAKCAIEKGVKVFSDTRVLAVDSQDGRVSTVKTSRGNISCEYFINCAGFWARNVGKLSRPVVNVPLQACAHSILHIKKTDDEKSTLPDRMPVIWDFDGSIYFHCILGGVVVTGFPDNVYRMFYKHPPDYYAFRTSKPLWDDNVDIMGALLRRVPRLATRKVVNESKSWSS